jgi:molybdopterin synthase catalytic subunit
VSAADSPARSRARLRAAPLSVDEVLGEVLHAGAGAVVFFLGTVRDHNDGRAVTRLEYEAYAPMAVEEMERIVRETEQAVPGARCALAHRTGALALGEIAVVCAASAPHRPEAFAACRRLIEEVKARVPIWKREHGPDGPYWVGWDDARCAHDTAAGETHVHADVGVDGRATVSAGASKQAQPLDEELRSAHDEDHRVHAPERKRP